MTRYIRISLLSLAFTMMLGGLTLKAQINLALSAVSTHIGGGASASGYGPELYNDGNIPTPCSVTGTYLWGWTNTNGWIEFTWATPQTFDKIVFYKANRPMSTCTIEYWDGSAYQSFYNYNNSVNVCEDSFTFPIVTTTRLRFNNIAGSSNPNFREIQVFRNIVYRNDAGVSSIESPPSVNSPGILSVQAKIRNSGSLTLTSVNLGWSINGVVQTAPSPWSGSLAPNAISGTITLGSFNFPAGMHKVKVWTSNPNGVADSNLYNDTLTKTINVCNVISGNFTIDISGNGDYLNFTSAIAAINACGINGPVNFTVKPGTYNERVVINNILGSSATNKVTFDGVDPDLVKLTWAGNASAYATVLINGADYVTFQNMTVENTGNTYAYTFCLMNSANYNTFDNLRLYVDQTVTTSTVNNFVATNAESSASTYGDCANNNIISNCIIKGGYYGVRFNGSSSSVKCNQNMVVNCVFDKQYYYGIYFYYQNEPSFINNYIAGLRTTGYGIYNYYGGNGGKIIGNTVITTYYGIYNYYCSASRIERNNIQAGYMCLYINQESNTTDSTMIVNNMIRHGSGPSYAYGYGLYLYYATKAYVYHNTIQGDTTYSSPTSYGIVRIYYGNNVKFKNNIIRSFGNLPLLNTDGAGLANGDIDYNIYFNATPGNIVAYWGSTSYTSLTAWKTAMPLFNMNSQQFEPQLVSKYDQHLKSTAPLYRGTPVGVSLDKDNDGRCIPMPTIGADEYAHPPENPDVDFFVNSSVCINSPHVFLNKASYKEPKLHYWFLNNQLVSTALNWVYTFDTVGNYNVKLVTRSCSYIDTVEKTVSVWFATKSPISQFILNNNLIEVYEPITLNDLSTGCPEKWKWQISPDSFFDASLGKNQPTYGFVSGSDSSRAPEIRFFYSGKYTICLTASNSIGKGTTYCLNDYIEVMPSYYLCTGKTETKENYGSLYDDGGYASNYSPNKSCSFYIHPCTDNLSFVFRSFDIALGDYIRVFDGSSNKGTPLWNTLAYPYGLNNFTWVPTLADTFFSTSGKIYIEFQSDGNTQTNGFGATWFSTPVAYPAPKASFLTNDTVCNGVPVLFKNTSTGTQPEYLWDYENDGTFDAFSTNGTKTYSSDGNYNIRLVVNACSGSDTIIKQIYVSTTYANPEIELIASNNTPNAASEIVTLSENTILNCVNSVNWSISPANYTLISGSLTGSLALNIIFDDTVCYDITAIGTYHGFEDTVFYPCFIKPIRYCKPSVNYLSNDIGISRIKVHTLDNSSEIGLKPYSDYFNDFTLVLERGAQYDISLWRNTNYNPMSRKVWIDLNHDGLFDDATELIAYDSLSTSLQWSGNFRLPVNTIPGVTRMRAATTLANSPHNPCGPSLMGEFEDYQVDIIPDITKPVITLVGGETVHVMECEPMFTEPGFKVWDNVDADLSNFVVVTGSIDLKVPGEYQLTYNVKDSEGNEALPVVRKVIVDAENVQPEISLLGNTTVDVQVFQSYTEEGYVATDTCSGLDTVLISNEVDFNKLGTYQIKYTAIDKQGNTITIARTVNIIDTIAPVLTSISDDTIILKVYHILPKPLYSLSDNYYKNVALELRGDFYQNFPNGKATELGFYNLVYYAEDGSGNSTSLNFVIHVVDNEKPTIQIVGNPFMTICRFDSLVDPGYTVSDNYDLNPQVTLSGTYWDDYYIYRNNGYYDVVYTATDQSGNKAVDVRYIYVTDRGPCFSAVSEQTLNSGIKLFPNPGNGLISMDVKSTSDEPIHIQVYNTLGEIVYNKSLLSTESIDISHLNPGIYFIRTEWNKKLYSWKYNLVK